MLGSSLSYQQLILGPIDANVEGLAAALLWGDPETSGVTVTATPGTATGAGQDATIATSQASTVTADAGASTGVGSDATISISTPGTVVSADAGSAAGVGATATIAAATVVHTGGVPSMTRLQTTASVVGSDGLVSRLKDGRYRYSYAWSCATGNWAALDLGTDATRTQILVCLSNESSGAGDIDDVGIANFTLKTSSDSTNGTDGTWTSYVVTDNPYIYASRVLPFTGCRWLRIEVGDGCTAIDELEVWNCTSGVDAYLFAGDSITNRGTKRHDAVQPSLQALINTRIGQYPAQIGAGIIGIGALTLDANIDAYLDAFPMCGHVLIGIGTNDAFAGSAGIAAFTTRVTSICNKVRAVGAEPILARIPWTPLAGYGGGTYGADNTCLYNQAIDGIVQSLGLRPGPDFYTYVYVNQTVWYNPAEGGDNVHPGTTGVKMWNAQWANVVDDLYGATLTGMGQAAGIVSAHLVAAAIGEAAGSGFDAGISTSQSVVVAADAGVATGEGSTVVTRCSIPADVGTATGVGQSVALNSAIGAAQGSATGDGSAAAISTSAALSVTAEPGDASGVGASAGTTSEQVVAAAAGSAAGAGELATISDAAYVRVTADPGSASGAGQSAGLTTWANVTASMGEAQGLGYTATTAGGVFVTAEPGSATGEGSSAAITLASLVAAATGAAIGTGWIALIVDSNAPIISQWRVVLSARDFSTIRWVL